LDFDFLQPEIQDYIIKNTGGDVSKLALAKNPFPNTDWLQILNQIAARAKAKDKLPSWFATAGIIYPSKVSVEQTSSEKTAAYKSGIVSGERLIDMSGGFGVDDFYFSKKVKQLVHCEINTELSAIVSHNVKAFSINNIECLNGDSTEILKQLDSHFDWIYIDPSRRNDAKGKVFMLKDCLPDVPELLGFYFSYADHILIKTAPILDISAGLSELHSVRVIHIVAVDNEVKELLWELSKGFTGSPELKTVNLTNDKTESFGFYPDAETTVEITEKLGKYLYEPNSAIMKSGGFEQIGMAYGLGKLHRHSHLYTSDQIISFPGRVFEIQKAIPYAKTEMKSLLQNGKFNITTRNFPETVEHIRKKWKIKDGGDQYCFFTTDANNDKIVLICTKINLQ